MRFQNVWIIGVNTKYLWKCLHVFCSENNYYYCACTCNCFHHALMSYEPSCFQSDIQSSHSSSATATFRIILFTTWIYLHEHKNIIIKSRAYRGGDVHWNMIIIFLQAFSSYLDYWNGIRNGKKSCYCHNALSLLIS